MKIKRYAFQRCSSNPTVWDSHLLKSFLYISVAFHLLSLESAVKHCFRGTKKFTLVSSFIYLVLFDCLSILLLHSSFLHFQSLSSIHFFLFFRSELIFSHIYHISFYFIAFKNCVFWCILFHRVPTVLLSFFSDFFLHNVPKIPKIACSCSDFL